MYLPKITCNLVFGVDAVNRKIVRTLKMAAILVSKSSAYDIMLPGSDIEFGIIDDSGFLIKNTPESPTLMILGKLNFPSGFSVLNIFFLPALLRRHSGSRRFWQALDTLVKLDCVISGRMRDDWEIGKIWRDGIVNCRCRITKFSIINQMNFVNFRLFFFISTEFFVVRKTMKIT